MDSFDTHVFIVLVAEVTACIDTVACVSISDIMYYNYAKTIVQSHCCSIYN